MNHFHNTNIVKLHVLYHTLYLYRNTETIEYQNLKQVLIKYFI